MTEDREDVTAIAPPAARTLGDRIRDMTQQLRQERTIQIQATSRILGAAAQLAINHDRLLDEVVEMVETDLDLQTRQPMYTVQSLKQQFKTLKRATAHFQITANRWDVLVTQLNAADSVVNTVPPVSDRPPETTEPPISDRLTHIEHAIHTMQQDIHHIHTVLIAIAEKLDRPQ